MSQEEQGQKQRFYFNWSLTLKTKFCNPLLSSIASITLNGTNQERPHQIGSYCKKYKIAHLGFSENFDGGYHTYYF